MSSICRSARTFFFARSYSSLMKMTFSSCCCLAALIDSRFFQNAYVGIKRRFAISTPADFACCLIFPTGLSCDGSKALMSV